MRARAAGEPIPEGGYQGDYVAELAAEIPDVADARSGGCRPRRGRDPARWQSRRRSRATEFATTASSASGRCTRVGRDRGDPRSAGGGRPRVPLRGRHVAAHHHASATTRIDRSSASTGRPTYLAADLAYLQNKRDRGFERQLLPVGADHHAYARELTAAMAALGADPDTLEMPILQFVHLVEGTERAAFSKRRGAFVTLDDLLDEIGVDATRFFMLRSSHDRTLDLDLDLARSQSAENPVYYIQYAHARIASMLGRVAEERRGCGARRRAAATGAADSGRRIERSTASERGADPQAARVPRRGRRGGRAPGAPPYRRIRARARPGVHRLLS